MNYLKSNYFCKSLLLLSVFVVLFSSCVKEDEENPDYAGTWTITETTTEDGETVQIKENLTLTKDGFADLIQIYDESSSKYIDFSKLIGKLSVSGTTMTVNLTKIGFTTLDVLTNSPTGTLVYYKKGDSTFELLMAQSGGSETFTSAYSVSGNKLTLTKGGELRIYTKQ